MAKADKNIKKTGSKPAVPKSSKEILAKAAALAKKKTPSISSDDSPESSSAEESSSADSDSSEEESLPTKSTATSVKKTASESSDSESDDDEESKFVPAKTSPEKRKKTPDSSDSEGDSSGASSSEESSSESVSDMELKSAPAKKSPEKGKKTSDSSDSEGDSSDASSSEESSSGSDSDEEENKISTPVPTVSEANKKRKVDTESAAVPKKVKLANGNAVASGEEIKSIFVGRLSWNVDNDWLAQEFAGCGEVESAHVQTDYNTGRSRGFGYVHFKTADAVEKALAMNGKEIDGRAVNIDRSNPPDKKASMEKRAQAFGDVSSPASAVLFVGNLSFGVDEDTLWETFGEHGDVKSVRVPTDRESGRPKGFAYVEFSEVGAAKKAHKALHGFELDGRPLRLDFSQPRDSSGGRGGGQGGWGGRGRGRGGFGGDRGRGAGRGGRGGDRGGRGRGRGRGARTGGIAQFEGQKITF